MQNQSSPQVTPALHSLGRAVAAGTLPDTDHAHAEALIDRMSRPMRVSVLGLPSAGKTAVMNFLAGQSLLTESLRGATIQMQYSGVERATLTLRDGSILVQDGPPEMFRIAQQLPAMVKLDLPLPSLRKISLLELAMPTDPRTQVRALVWAIKRTDIAIWCTEDFTREEQGLWDMVPPEVKDHSILLRTKSEAFPGNALDTVSHVDPDDFGHVLAFSALQAFSARDRSGHVDKEALRAAGGMKLVSTVLKQIESGRQNAEDQAELILARAGADVAPQLSPEPQPAPAAAKHSEPVETVAPAQSPEFLSEAVGRLAGLGVSLAARRAEPREVLQEVTRAITWLETEIDHAGPGLAHWRTRFQDAADTVELLKIEGADDGATEAVCIVLQLKRGLAAEQTAA